METPAAAVPLSPINLTLPSPAPGGQAFVAMVEAGTASFKAGCTVELETTAAGPAPIRRAP